MPKPSVFIGSSSGKGLEISRNIAAVLNSTGICEATAWPHMFTVGSSTLQSLIAASNRVDFAVLVATPDDAIVKKKTEAFAPRDNVIFELGMFIGSLGPERVYLVTDQSEPLTLPTDLAGVTYIPYESREDNNMPAAVDSIALKFEERIQTLGSRQDRATVNSAVHVDGTDSEQLRHELDRIQSSALNQGWQVQKSDEAVLRLKNRHGKNFTFQHASNPRQSREDLRRFAAKIRANGLRVSHSVRRPLDPPA